MLNRHFSIYLVAYILPAAVGFFAVTAYTRLLTPAEYGVYVVGISLAGILGAIFFAWMIFLYAWPLARKQARSRPMRGVDLLRQEAYGSDAPPPHSDRLACRCVPRRS